MQAAAKATDQIRDVRAEDSPTSSSKLGKTVVEVDREAFREAAMPLHNDAAAAPAGPGANTTRCRR